MRAAGTILFITSCPLPWGGSEELWAGAAERLHARGYTVFTGRSELLPRGDLHPRWQALGRDGVGGLDLCVGGLERAIPNAFRRFWPALEPRAIEIRDRRLAARMRRLRERGARFVEAPNFAPKVAVSERLVTGQNPASATGVAEATVGLVEGR